MCIVTKDNIDRTQNSSIKSEVYNMSCESYPKVHILQLMVQLI